MAEQDARHFPARSKNYNPSIIVMVPSFGEYSPSSTMVLDRASVLSPSMEQLAYKGLPSIARALALDDHDCFAT